MKKLLLAGIGLLSLSAAPTMAADLPVYKARPPVIASYSWTGCYAAATWVACG